MGDSSDSAVKLGNRLELGEGTFVEEATAMQGTKF